MKFKHLPAILVALTLIGCGAKKENQSNKSTPKTPAQYVEQARFAPIADADTVDVSDFKGKVVMIDFWETWCKPCIGSFPGIQKLTQEYPDDFVVLAVTPGFTDTKQKAREFAEAHDYDFTYLYDSNGLHKKLNVRGIPFKAFIDADGNFIKTEMGSAGPKGDYQKIKKIIEANKAGAHSTKSE